MGTWGTAIKESDSFADIYSEFYDLYNKGEQPHIISHKISAYNREMLEIDEDKHSFWFALALAQWETKSLDPAVLSTVENIITSGDDLKLWFDLGASEQDIKKRKIALDKFLAKIKSDRPKAKSRKQPKIKTPIFSTGDCLVFKMKSGNYGGAVVLATDHNPETAYNLVATTRLNQETKPNLADFENAETLICNFGQWQDKPDVNWYMPDLFDQHYSNIYECVGKIAVEKDYNVNDYSGKGYLFYPSYASGWGMNNSAEKQFESEVTKSKPTSTLTIRQLTKKDKWWKIF